MSTSAPTPGGSGTDSQGDPRNLHDMAVDVTTDLQKLATGLAHAGANPQAVQQLTKMAEVTGQIVKVLNESPAVEQAAQHGAGPQGPPPGAAPQQGAPAPGPAGPAGPAQPPHPQQAMQAAAQGLHQMMQAAAQQRAAQGR